MAERKEQLVEQIRRYNRHVAAEFLQRFDEPTLSAYLMRLTRLVDHRGRESRWIRHGPTPAVCVHIAR